MTLRAKQFPALFSFSRALALLALLTCGAHAQFSVAPSQTGSFFNDLRVRANEVRAGANAADANRGQVTGSEGVYDFTRGQYVGEPVEQRELGVPTSTNAIER